MTIQEIKERNKKAGGHFFDPETMKCFRSRVSEETFPLPNGDCYFITSEKPPSGRRMHKIRLFKSNGRIVNTNTPAFVNAGTAKYQAKKMAEMEG